MEVQAEQARQAAVEAVLVTDVGAGHKPAPRVSTTREREVRVSLLRGVCAASCVCFTLRRYRLRKHKKDDVEAFHKLQQLRMELHRGLELVELTRMREQSKRELLDIAEDQFNQAMHDLLDKSGKPYEPVTLLRVRFGVWSWGLPCTSRSLHDACRAFCSPAVKDAPNAEHPGPIVIPPRPGITSRGICSIPECAAATRAVNPAAAQRDGQHLAVVTVRTACARRGRRPRIPGWAAAGTRTGAAHPRRCRR